MYAFSTISLASCWLGEPVATLLSMVNKRGHKQSLVHVFVAVDIWNKLESWEALPCLGIGRISSDETAFFALIKCTFFARF